MDYNDFVLRINPSPEAGRFVVSATSATAGEASGAFVSPFSDTELENFVLKIGLTRRGVRRINSPEWRAAQVFGEKLFRQLFAEDIRSTFLASRNDALREGKGLRVKFIVDAPALANYPWEFLYDPSLGRFLSLYESTPIVRYVELSSPPQVLRVAPPLRVLVLASSPSDYPPLDLAREKSNLDSALAELVQQNQIAVDWLPNASLEALRSQLLKRQYHIFHFIGHGGFDEAAGDGVLIFEDESKRSRPISGEQLAVLLGNRPTLRLAFLNSCEGARTSVLDPFAGSAMTLVKSGGLSAVVAMQFEITDEASIAFTRGFYGALAVGNSVDAAVAQARLTIFADDNDVEWGTPVLYLRASDGVIFVPLSPEEIARGRAEEAKRERERQEAERIAKEQAEAESVAWEKAEGDRIARDQVEKESLAREQAEQEKQAKAKAEAERLAREQAERDRVLKLAGLYRTAQQQFANKNYVEALNTLTSLLALDPVNSAALDLKAKIESILADQERLANEKIAKARRETEARNTVRRIEAERSAQQKADSERATRTMELYRAAQKSFAQKKYDDTLNSLALLLANDPLNAAARDLKARAEAARAEQERIVREQVKQEVQTREKPPSVTRLWLLRQATLTGWSLLFRPSRAAFDQHKPYAGAGKALLWVGISGAIYGVIASPRYDSGVIIAVVVFAFFSIISFLVWEGILYLLARLFRGKGKFWTQAYLQSLFQIPLAIVGGILSILSRWLFGVDLLLGLSLFANLYALYPTIIAMRSAHSPSTQGNPSDHQA